LVPDISDQSYAPEEMGREGKGGKGTERKEREGVKGEGKGLLPQMKILATALPTTENRPLDSPPDT